jgi:hypothetical protein
MSSSRRRAYGDFSCAAQLKSVAWVTRASRLAPCDVRYGVIGGSRHADVPVLIILVARRHAPAARRSIAALP